MADPARAQEREKWREHIRQSDRKGATRAARGVIDREGVDEEIDKIVIPTLIIVGEEDIATPPETARQMHEKIPHSQLVTIPVAGHSSNVEQPGAVNDALRTFLRN